MPSSILGDNLIDDLVPTVDELRAELYADFGVTQYEVRLVKRRWSGTRRGEGTITVLQDLVMSPAPLFVDGDRYRLMPHGRDEIGDAVLLEVSLMYTEAELTGGTIAENEEFFYEVRDARGQVIATQHFELAEPPSTDREKSIGWTVKLRRAEVSSS
jgi:hypothetical protein